MGWKRKPYYIPDVSPNQHVKDRKRAVLALGRPLAKHQHVHHHSATQLVICQDWAYHKLLHRRTVAKRFGYDPSLVYVCDRCQRAYSHAHFDNHRGGLHSLCVECGYYRPENLERRMADYAKYNRHG